MTLDDLLATLRESIIANGGDSTLASKVERDLRKAKEEEKADKEPVKRGSTQLSILVSDPDGRLKGMQLLGWVIQTESECAPQAAYERLVRSANDFNNSKRGRRNPVATLGEACQTLKGKWLRQEGGAKLTIPKASRHPIAVQAVPNKLPA